MMMVLCWLRFSNVISTITMAMAIFGGVIRQPVLKVIGRTITGMMIVWGIVIFLFLLIVIIFVTSAVMIGITLLVIMIDREGCRLT